MAEQTFDEKIIAEFRANGGKVGGPLSGRPLLLLTTMGAKSGQPRTAPLGYLSHGGPLLVFASNLGAPKAPAWYHNVLAHPAVTVEVESESYAGHASVISGEERERLWPDVVAAFPFLVEHQARARRTIPLVLLERGAAR